MGSDFLTRSDRTPAHIAYGLMAVSVFTGLPMLIAVLVAWLNRRSTFDIFMISHYTWQIRTFWINLVVAAIGFILTPVLIGWAILFINQVWLIYRVAAGWYFLANDRTP